MCTVLAIKELGWHQCYTVCACVWLLIFFFFNFWKNIYWSVMISSVSLVLEMGDVQTQHSCCLNLLARLRAIGPTRQLSSQELLCMGLFFFLSLSAVPSLWTLCAWQSSSLTTVLQTLWNPIYWFFLAFLKSSFSFPTGTLRLIEPMGWQCLSPLLWQPLPFISCVAVLAYVKALEYCGVVWVVPGGGTQQNTL